MIPKIKGTIILNTTIIQNFNEICEFIGCAQQDLRNYIEWKLVLNTTLAPTHLRIRSKVSASRLNRLIEDYYRNLTGGKSRWKLKVI